MRIKRCVGGQLEWMTTTTNRGGGSIAGQREEDGNSRPGPHHHHHHVWTLCGPNERYSPPSLFFSDDDSSPALLVLKSVFFSLPPILPVFPACYSRMLLVARHSNGVVVLLLLLPDVIVIMGFLREPWDLFLLTRRSSNPDRFPAGVSLSLSLSFLLVISEIDIKTLLGRAQQLSSTPRRDPARRPIFLTESQYRRPARFLLFLLLDKYRSGESTRRGKLLAHFSFTPIGHQAPLGLQIVGATPILGSGMSSSLSSPAGWNSGPGMTSGIRHHIPVDIQVECPD